MTIEQAFEDLLTSWSDQPADYQKKYKSYRSKSKGKEGLGIGKKIEMLENGGYKITVTKIKQS